MRTDLTPAFVTEMNKKSCSPVTLVEFQFATGTVYASDHTVVVGNRTYTGIVAKWGALKPGKHSSEFGSMGADMEIEMDNTKAYPFSNYLVRNVPENTVVVVSQWFKGLALADVAEVDRFYCSVVAVDEMTCKLKLFSFLERFDKHLGRLINRSDFPKADYGAVGNALGYVLGSVGDVRFEPIHTGWQSALVDDIDATTIGNIYFRTNGTAGKVTDLPTSGSIYIGDERVYYSSRVYHAPTSSTDTHNNYIVCSSRSSNARPFVQGTVAFEYLAEGYTYGKPYHASQSVANVRCNGIPQSSGFTVNLDNTTILPGQHLTTINFTTHPRLLKNVGTHSHVARRTVRRNGFVGNFSFTSTGGSLNVTAKVPSNVGTAQNGYIDIICHLAAFTFAVGHAAVTVPVTISGAHVTSQTVYMNNLTSSSAAFPDALRVRVPISNIDFSADVFTINIAAVSGYTGSTGTMAVDAVEWVIEYTGGDSVNAEVKDRIDVAGNTGALNFSGTAYTSGISVSGSVPQLIAVPQEVFLRLRLRVSTWTFSSTAGWANIRITGSKITTVYVQSETFKSTVGANGLPTIDLLVRVENPDLTAATFSATISAGCGLSGDSGGLVLDEATWVVEYPLGNSEVITGLEVVSHGPSIIARVDGVVQSVIVTEDDPVDIVIDSCDTASNWVSSASSLVVAQDTTLKQEGTGCVKLTGAVTTVLQKWESIVGIASLGLRYNTTTQYELAQNGIALVNGQTVDKVQLALAKVGLPLGNMYVELRAGVASGLPTGTVLATSNLVAASSVPVGINWIDFTFAAPVVLAGVTAAYGVDVVLRSDQAAGTVSTTNYVLWYATNPAYTGVNSSQVCGYNYSTVTWVNNYSADFNFRVYSNGAVGQNALLTKSPVVDLTGYNTIKLWVRSNRTGDYLQFQFGESVVNENIHNITILTADTWEEKAIDISALSDASKNALQYFSVKCIDASVSFITYVDDVRAVTAVVQAPLETPVLIPPDGIRYLTALCGITNNTTKFNNATTFTEQVGMTFNGVIDGYPLLTKVLKQMQEECLCACWMSRGVMQVVYIPNAETVMKTIEKSQVTEGIVVGSTMLDDVVNTLNINYNYTMALDEYQAHLLTTDSTSVTAYGERGKVMKCQFITTDTMASLVAEYYKAQRKDRKLIVNFTTLLDNFELEQFDVVFVNYNVLSVIVSDTVGLSLNAIPQLIPGSGTPLVCDKITFTAIENDMVNVAYSEILGLYAGAQLSATNTMDCVDTRALNVGGLLSMTEAYVGVAAMSDAVSLLAGAALSHTDTFATSDTLAVLAGAYNVMSESVVSAFIRDTFTESSDVAFNSHTPETGNAWKLAVGTQQLSIIAAYGALRPTSTTLAYHYNDTTPPSADYKVKADVTIVGTNNATHNMQLGVRSNATTTTRYRLKLNGDGSCNLYRDLAGAGLLLGTYTPTFDNNMHQYEMHVIGSAIKVYRDGTLIISATNSDITTAGYASITGKYVSSSQLVQIDNLVYTQ